MSLSEAEELELLSLERERSVGAQTDSTAPSFGQTAINAAKHIGSVSLEGAKQVATMSPKVQRMTASALPVVGGIAGAPFGLGAPGAAAGEFARQAVNTVINPEANPQTPLGMFASTVGAGIAQEPKILNAIPGVSRFGNMAGNLASKAGKNLAKFGEALTGAKAKDLEQAARQGLSTYGAPNMEEAQTIFGKAMESAGIPGKPPLKQIIDPQLSTARKIALQVGDKLEKGVDIGAGEALQGRQAIDRIYNATPLVDRATRGNLADLRTAFDNVIAGKSGALKEASTLYRQAIVKSNLLNPFRITKQGQMSAVAPMVATLAASAGVGSGHKGQAGLGGVGYLAASSPALAGAIATSGGSAVNAFGSLASRPEVRQVLLQALAQAMQKRKNKTQEP